MFFFFFKQKTAYEMRISDWSSDVCSSDVRPLGDDRAEGVAAFDAIEARDGAVGLDHARADHAVERERTDRDYIAAFQIGRVRRLVRSEEHTSELQSLMRIPYAVVYLKKKKKRNK